MTTALVDDGLLGSVLRGRTPQLLRRFDLATTGYWYVRLCHPAFGNTGRPGVLSAPFEGLPPALRDRSLALLAHLPDDITLVSLRHLAPVMGRLRRRYSLNILGTEALAAAVHLPADVFLSVPSPRLEAALREEGRPCRVVA